MKTTPKTLYVRYIENEKKFSVGEYIRAKWNNVCKPFLVNDETSLKLLKNQILTYKLKTKRDIVLAGYLGSKSAEKLTKLLK